MRKRVPTNLIYQNCFIHLTTPPSDLKTTHSSTGKSDLYTNLSEVTTSDGVKLEKTLLEYPITPEYVNSFRSADYHLDPVGSVLNSKPSPNLGDIRDLQRLTSADTETLAAICSELSSRLSTVKQQQKTETSDVPPTEIKTGDVK